MRSPKAPRRLSREEILELADDTAEQILQAEGKYRDSYTDVPVVAGDATLEDAMRVAIATMHAISRKRTAIESDSPPADGNDDDIFNTNEEEAIKLAAEIDKDMARQRQKKKAERKKNRKRGIDPEKN